MRLAWRSSGLFRRMFPRSNSRTNCARCRYRSCRVTKTTISEAVAAAGWPRQAPATRAINSGRVIWKNSHNCMLELLGAREANSRQCFTFSGSSGLFLSNTRTARR